MNGTSVPLGGKTACRKPGSDEDADNGKQIRYSGSGVNFIYGDIKFIKILLKKILVVVGSLCSSLSRSPGGSPWAVPAQQCLPSSGWSWHHGGLNFWLRSICPEGDRQC